MRKLAVPLPLTVITDLLGLALADMPRLARWSNHATALLAGINTREQLVGYGRCIGELNRYLAEDEVVSMLFQLLSAGNETTASLIGSAI